MTEHADYVDRQGKPIELSQWAKLWADMSYRVVAEHRHGDLVVRTIWEGIATIGHLFYVGVSKDGGRTFVDVAHADTEANALHQHERVVAGRHPATAPRTFL